MTIDWSKVVTVEHKETEALDDLKKKVTSLRYDNETKGIVVQGIPVGTGRDSQGLISGACLAALLDPEYVVNWKGDGGVFVQLNAQQIISLATAVRAHVQSCFDREYELITHINNGTFKESMLTEGWN